jgi:hypothetical protein
MAWTSSSVENLRRVFREGFAARDIAEPLLSFDASTSAAEILRVMERHDFDVVGVRQEGCVAGYANRSDQDEVACWEHLRPFDDAHLISDSAPLTDVVLGLAKSPRLFVRVLGAVGGIITMSDLQKPQVRMWLFGMITLIEMRVSRLIDQLCPGDSWKQYVSESRLQKADALLAERRRRNQSLELVDCLQFSDKGQIIARNDAIRNLTRFTSRRQVEEAIKALESLRNNLAHSQDILSCDWATIVMLCRDLEGVISGTEQVQRVLEASRPPHAE